MNIINPVSGEKVSIYSEYGRLILKLYIMNYKNGGNDCSQCEAEAERDKQLRNLLWNNINNLLKSKNAKIYKNKFERINSALINIARPPCAKHSQQNPE